MTRFLMVSAAALLLAGCVAQWPSNRIGPRWSGGPNVSPIQGNAPSMPGGNAASGDPIGAVHGIGY